MTKKSSLELCLPQIRSYNAISFDPENESKCCLKTLKNGPENPENGIKNA